MQDQVPGMFFQGQAHPVTRPDAMLMQTRGIALQALPQRQITEPRRAKFNGRFIAMAVRVALQDGRQIHSPHSSPVAAKITPDLSRLRVSRAGRCDARCRAEIFAALPVLIPARQSPAGCA